jgi:cation:H+ antiporter
MSAIPVILVVLGFGALLIGAEFLVRGASRLALAFGISPLVVGLTVVAFGTSAPEAAVGVFSTLTGQGDIAVGNIVGSNIFNILFVLGLAALIAPLIVAQQVVRREAPIMIGVSVLFYVLALDGTINRFDGALLFGGVILYTVWAISRSRTEQKQVADEYQAEFGVSEAEVKGASVSVNIAWVVGGLALLLVGSQVAVTGAAQIARLLGVSELMIGLTIVALGTSLPEVATSVVATLRNERDIAVGNIIGSNLFNLLAVFGVTALVAPGGVAIAQTVLRFDLPIMIGVSLATLPILFTGHRISRLEGALLFSGYWVYLAFLIGTA